MWIFSVERVHRVQKALPQPLQTLVDAALGGLTRDVAGILKTVGASLSREGLAALVNIGNQAGVEQLLRQAWNEIGERGLQDTLAPRLQALAVQAAEVTAIVGIDVAFNVQDPEALQAINVSIGREIVAISETTREAIRGIVQRAFESGTTVTQQMAEIAEVVGLTPRQAESVARYRQGLVEAGETPGRVQDLVARRGLALRLQRAEVISRTEGLNAVHIGQQQRWEQAARVGALDATRLRRFWILGPRPCPTICVPIPGMNPDGVGLAEPFQTPVGPLMHPTAHPQCMCAVSGRVTV